MNRLQYLKLLLDNGYWEYGWFLVIPASVLHAKKLTLALQWLQEHDTETKLGVHSSVS